ncbi:hypothetical protein H4F99_05365 [Lysobacter sp. SG-8]|uniref:DUF4145 domain-containing protein n=1 Tax=Marilutibacter penaei TaxID=2759900 RepID=A0A7W3YE95_9GAMM|nr:hypothetical protein [Lysobacter penaei]MBB1087917.1 hypothetical protein [Lysobacter penaei]
MQSVEDRYVQSRFSNTFPRTVELTCPHCLKVAVLEARSWQEHGHEVAASEMTCSRCEGSVLFIQLLTPEATVRENGLYCYPGSARREAMPGVNYLQSLSGPLARTYDSALKLYNTADWGASALMVRHLLQGLVIQLLGETHRDQPLARQLEALPGELDLSRPLQDVAQLLEPAGTFGRQFDDEAAIDKVSADLLMELAEQLMTYLVVMPGTMEDLKKRIATAPVPLRRGSDVA